MNFEIRDFEEDLKTGNRAEELILSKFKSVVQPLVERVMYNDGVISKNLQKAGVDAFISKKETGFDVKSRDFRYYQFQDILLETVSIREYNIPGWLFITNAVVYVWWNKRQTKFVDGYILFLQNIRNWFESKPENYRRIIAHSGKGNKTWSTESIIVPITDFPLGCIYKINKKEFQDSTQTDFKTFFD